MKKILLVISVMMLVNCGREEASHECTPSPLPNCNEKACCTVYNDGCIECVYVLEDGTEVYSEDCDGAMPPGTTSQCT